MSLNLLIHAMPLNADERWVLEHLQGMRPERDTQEALSKLGVGLYTTVYGPDAQRVVAVFWEYQAQPGMQVELQDAFESLKPRIFNCTIA